jgi:prefoldin alpha subunit
MSESQSVDVSTLPPQELQKLRQSLNDDIQLITNNFGNLKVAQARFAQGLEALLDLKPENEGKPMLIPLTGSLYVPGQLADHNKVVVDVGTGKKNSQIEMIYFVFGIVIVTCSVVIRCINSLRWERLS